MDIVEQWKNVAPIVCWASLPCTWGSPYQDVNAKLFPANHEARMKAHWDLFVALHKSFMRLAEKVEEANGKIVFEWPRKNALWSQPQVQHMIQKHELRPVQVDGCMLGLKSEERSENGKKDGR